MSGEGKKGLSKQATVISIFFIISIMLCSLFPVATADTSDISQTNFTYDQFHLTGEFGYTEIFAQSFITTMDELTRVIVFLNRTVYATNGSITLEVSASRYGATLTSKSILVTDVLVASFCAAVDFNFTDISVTPGNEYWIRVVLTANQGDHTSNYVTVGASPTNSGMFGVGDCWDYDGFNWFEHPDHDLAFITYGNENEDPVASFTYSYTNLTVDVNASTSSDLDGSITEYAWDWTNDGVYDDYGVTESHTYGSNGTYTIKLRVTDNQGASDNTTATVTVKQGTSGEGEDGDPPGAGFHDWFTFLLDLPFFVIILIIAIVFVMAGSLAFFIKPEVIGPPGNLGIVPSVSTLFVGILSIITIILWYAEFEMIYILICAVMIAVVLALNFKYFFGGKR